MNIRNKIIAFNGICKLLRSYDIGKVPRNFRKYDYYINEILLSFGKENGITLTPHNSKNYKGQFKPSVENSAYISANCYELFVQWLDNKYKKL